MAVAERELVRYGYGGTIQRQWLVNVKEEEVERRRSVICAASGRTLRTMKWSGLLFDYRASLFEIGNNDNIETVSSVHAVFSSF